ncbi:YceI family protein [Conexibacter woesei]|uniref:YceI family protein n=1 Tax=Conexibacter woesei TaxID=191495 RepID=UPI000412C3AF|nr:YceI family protein [Conexibacter woesei]
MSPTSTTPPLTGTFHANAISSTFAFAVRHSGVFWFRGSLADVSATLRADPGGDAPSLEGSAQVASISIAEPEAMRASVLGPQFFDAADHPELTFRSTAIRFAPDGTAEVEGDLTMRGVTLPVTAGGRYDAPRLSGFGEIMGLELHTTLDRRDFGFDWQAELPSGGDGVSWEVQLDIDLLLVREADDAGR